MTPAAAAALGSAPAEPVAAAALGSAPAEPVAAAALGSAPAEPVAAEALGSTPAEPVAAAVCSAAPASPRRSPESLARAVAARTGAWKIAFAGQPELSQQEQLAEGWQQQPAIKRQHSIMIDHSTSCTVIRNAWDWEFVQPDPETDEASGFKRLL